MKPEAIIVDLAKRIEARRAGSTTGYGETHSLEIIIDVEVVPYLDWSLLLEGGADVLTEEEHEQTKEIARLTAEARELYNL